MRLDFLKYFMFLLRFAILLGITTYVKADSSNSNVPSDIQDINSECGPDIYCLPKAGDLWVPQENGFLQWNKNYPTFLNTGSVNIGLYNTLSGNPVQLWNHYRNEGILVINNFTTDWFLDLNNVSPYENITQEFYFDITAIYDTNAPYKPGPTFFIERPMLLPTPILPATPMHNKTSTTSTSTKPTSTSPSPSSSSFSYGPTNPSVQTQGTSGLSAGAIGGIAVGSVLLVTIVACLFYILRRRRRNQLAKPGLGTNSDHNSSHVIVNAVSDNNSDNDVDGQLQMAEASSPVKRNSLRLTVKGAQELAHAYRKMLTNQDAIEDSQPSSQQRNLYSDELLRRELAAEGHGVKNVSTSPAIVVVGEDQNSLCSMTADTTDSSEL
ncbi:hypothetical protein K7432_006643 [Basidiobolus ranarum]|uniref:Mid2 domain-containing protein n=1 Tax=Basidiobolus ranarum TaxID=34480 RepID=A0ABR2W1B7_9FUNG